MREIIVIEKDELMDLSVLIAEEIITFSEKFYGFTMISRDSKKEMDEDGMIGVLAPAIRKGFKKGLVK